MALRRASACVGRRTRAERLKRGVRTYVGAGAHGRAHGQAGRGSLLGDEDVMALALREARAAFYEGEVPVGAVVHYGDEVLASCRNATEQLNDPTAHAELLALRRAASALGSWKRLSRATLAVTVEPCAMCAGAALQARVARVVYGARSPNVGGDGSWCSVLRSGGSQHPLHPGLAVHSGVCADECSELMSEFFKQRRSESGSANAHCSHAASGTAIAPAVVASDEGR